MRNAITPVYYDLYIPKHMCTIQCVDVAEQFNFNLGNVLKYIWRAGKKDQNTEIEDLEKARYYIEREIERIQSGKDYTDN